MQVLPNLDPTTIGNMVGGSDTVSTGLTTGCGTVYYMNKSNVGINIKYDNGFTITLPAWYARPVVLQNKSLRQTFTPVYTLNQQNPPISQLYMEAYQKGEDTTGLYSGPIPYQNTSSITTGVVTANNVISTGIAAGSDIITGQPSGDTNPAVVLTNDGNLALGSATRTGSIDMPGGGATVGSLTIQDVINLVSGTISRLSLFGPYTLSTTPAFFNHNLGAIPDGILLTILGTNSTVEMAKYDDATLTSTQVKLVSNGSFRVIGIAYKK